MEKLHIKLPSTDKHAVLYVTAFTPTDGIKIKGLIQICHGMTEHIGRYEQLAQYFTDRGYIVFGNDSISHGKSTTTQSTGLYFADWFDVVKDAIRMQEYAKQKYPKTPMYLIGFSLGSFVVRSMPNMRAYKKQILVGTGYQNIIVLKLMRKLLSMRFADSMKIPSDAIKKLAFDAYNKKFPKQAENYWLITDAALRERYQNDALVRLDMTPGFFCEFLKGMIHTAEALQNPNNTNPTLFLYGEHDPVGNFGKGVRKVFQAYQRKNAQTSIASLSGTHDILHDCMCERAFDMICKFIEE